MASGTGIEMNKIGGRFGIIVRVLPGYAAGVFGTERGMSHHDQRGAVGGPHEII